MVTTILVLLLLVAFYLYGNEVRKKNDIKRELGIRLSTIKELEGTLGVVNEANETLEKHVEALKDYSSAKDKELIRFGQDLAEKNKIIENMAFISKEKDKRLDDIVDKLNTEKDLVYSLRQEIAVLNGSIVDNSAEKYTDPVQGKLWTDEELNKVEASGMMDNIYTGPDPDENMEEVYPVNQEIQPEKQVETKKKKKNKKR